MIKVGVIGLGEVAQLMHMPILHDLEAKYRVTAVSDISPSLVAFVKEKYNIAQGYLDFRELIEKADTDAIWVLSPDQYHGEAVKLALRAGKHIFVEKPATLAAGELEEVIELRRQYPNQIVMVGFMRRYTESFLKAKEILTESPKSTKYLRFRDIICEGPFFIGQTRPVFYPKDLPKELLEEGRKRQREHLDQAIGGGASDLARAIYTLLTGLGCHSFSAVRELFGLPKKVLHVAAKGEHVVVSLDYGDFLAVYELVSDQDVVQFDAAIEIFQGDRKIHIKYETPYIRCQPTTLLVTEPDKAGTKTTYYGPDHTDPFQTELHCFAECVATGSQPKTTLEDSLSDLRLFEEIIRKLEED
ncbi:MAG: Gfo/Idh/MocA family oxidoreductase [Oscillospiraceae bacterium]|nr:Gfo/Idh/MocA family oxidoreductase [Oscillospiraceae bacterium]